MEYARYKGVKIGDGCCILGDVDATFGSEPWLVEIGNHVEITAGVRFITHDGALWVIRNSCGGGMDYFGKIMIGNNCFVGLNALIMPNVTIGDNCVIGAGAVVTKDIPDNSVAVGVPAKVLKSIDAYYKDISIRAVPTNGMSIAEKKEFLKSKFPEWNL